MNMLWPVPWLIHHDEATAPAKKRTNGHARGCLPRMLKQPIERKSLSPRTQFINFCKSLY